MRRLKDLAGRTALVTGASSGIGRALALRLASCGARVALVARRREALAEVAADIEEKGGQALVLPCDVAQPEAVAAAAARATDHFGSVDLLVNNAGYGHHRRFLEWDLADIERMVHVNYLGSVYFTKALLGGMVQRGMGWIVFVASVAGRIAPPEEAAYAASKFALVGFAEALSLEVEDAGVHILTVCPGVIRTPFFDAEAMARMPPVARRAMAEPEGLVDAILRALERGRREITYPRHMAAAYSFRALAPEFTRRQIRRSTLGALERRAREDGGRV